MHHTLSCTARPQHTTRTTSKQEQHKSAMTSCHTLHPACTHLDEANIVRALTEALSAHIEVVLADQTVAVSCDQTHTHTSQPRNSASSAPVPSRFTHRTRGSGGLRGRCPWGARSAEPCIPSAKASECDWLGGSPPGPRAHRSVRTLRGRAVIGGFADWSSVCAVGHPCAPPCL